MTFNERANDLDKERKKMNLLVNKIYESLNRINEIISKYIICPECKENIFIEFDQYKINIHGCKNNHRKNNISLAEYFDTQVIDLSEIKSEICNNNRGKILNYEFFMCNTCNKNICPLCKTIHDKNNKIMEYDDKKYICQSHNDPFAKYYET